MALRDVSSYQELIEFVVKNNGIAIVEFHTYAPSPWRNCEPCKLIQPHILSLRNTYKVPLARVDTEKADELVSKFDIHALPTFLLIRKIGSDIEIAKTVVSAHV